MKKQECLQAAIESSHQDFRRIELEIRPVFLVLDTNCLIDHLRSIQKLLATRKYTFIIPLVGECTHSEENFAERVKA